jgi:hypothetical protein
MARNWKGEAGKLEDPVAREYYPDEATAAELSEEPRLKLSIDEASAEMREKILVREIDRTQHELDAAHGHNRELKKDFDISQKQLNSALGHIRELTHEVKVRVQALEMLREQYDLIKVDSDRINKMSRLLTDLTKIAFAHGDDALIVKVIECYMRQRS